MVRVGVPASGFTVSGPGLSGRMATGIASLVIVNVTQGAPCYGAPGGVVVVEVDPIVEQARQTEFQLCGSGGADPSTCVADNYVAPDHSVRGSVASDGTTATIWFFGLNRLCWASMASDVGKAAASSGLVR